MRSRISLSPPAKSDLAEIKAYYVGKASADVAIQILSELRFAIRELARRPGLGHKREDLTKDDVLFWLVRSYLVVYRHRAGILEVVGVLHGARDIPSILPDRT